MNIPFSIDTHIKIDRSLLSRDILLELEEYLLIEPSSYSDDHIIFNFYRENDSHIVLPRGFLSRFEGGLRESGLTPVRNAEYADAPVQRVSSPITLRPHQQRPIECITSNQDFTGIYVAPPGSGKTATALECIRRSGQRALVLVDRASVADQWIDRAEQFLDITPTKIGEGVFELSDFTVAMKQTLWSKVDKLDDEFFDMWGFVVVDECHAIQSLTYQKIIQRFRPKYLLGLSATPHKKQGYQKIVECMIGAIEVETKPEELLDSNYLMKPTVNIYNTDLEVEYKTWLHRGIKRNNYSSILKKLVEDTDRNNLIAKAVVESDNKKRLLVTKRLKHIDLISKAIREIDDDIKLLKLTGKESPQERKELIDSLDKLDNYLVLSTVADEAIDIPSLDALFNVFPVRNLDLLKQIIGRIERSSEGKKAPLFVDFNDHLSNIFNNQFSDRLFYYKENNLDIKIVNPIRQ